MKAQAKSLTEMAPEPEVIRWLALACMAAAILSGLLLGLWELAHPFFGQARYRVVVPPVQLWSYAILQVFKSAGFLAGLFGLFLVATWRFLDFSRAAWL
jgi:H+/Cl- antiporter ClcA